MSSPSGVDHAVIGGVVAVIVFILLCLLIIFGRYLIRHKGRLLTPAHVLAHTRIHERSLKSTHRSIATVMSYWEQQSEQQHTVSISQTLQTVDVSAECFQL